MSFCPFVSEIMILLSKMVVGGWVNQSKSGNCAFFSVVNCKKLFKYPKKYF